ncbi:tumor protein p53 inducible nuclear protein 2 [Nesidiocoris tenuis]|uniref:Tumor protein p53 inducible nuclear protein 2 n=1 Tax=Nesidiocoris tenuis TaxID=355587 RepID=A0ABN7B858_9HEMI|nr:tumor protein p53 inducible nuclear protein 2 [Nesidiocoris tenuis]
MLSNLASYLLGYGAGAAEDNSTSDDRTTQPNVDENVRLTTVPVDDDDWLMVETARDGERRSSTGSLPNVNLEESWFVTPPPCFTSTGPVTLETSPLENLLIEHPSMSVYTRSTGGSVSSTAGSSSRTAGGRPEQQRGPPPRGARSLSPPVPRRPNANNAAPAPRPRAPLQPNQLHNMQVQALHQAQKHQLMKESQAMRSKQIERQNKTKDRRSRRPKRNDKQKNLSGANNNRKCC